MRTLVFILCVTGCAFAADERAEWDAARRAVMAYEEGKSRAELSRVEDQIRAALGDPARCAGMEARLIEMLGAGATADGTRFVCRQLSMIGTAACVPHLAPLLSDPKVSDIARFALEAIPDESVDKTLLAALPASAGRQRLGIVSSLGARRTAGALGALEGFLAAPDDELAGMAASAMERIGTEAALTALVTAYPGAPAARKPRLAACAMAVAHAVLAKGRPGPAEEAFVAFFTPGQPRAVRAAALQGLLAVDGGKHGPRILEILRSEDDELQGLAAGLLRTIPDRESVRRIVRELSTLSPGVQALALAALAERGETEALSVALERCRSDTPELATAACEAVGALGGANEVATLLTWLDDPGARAGARAALTKLRGPGVDEAILRAMDGRTPAVQDEAARILVARVATSTVPALLRMAGSSAGEPRAAFFRAAGELANGEQIPLIVAHVVEARDAAVCASAGKALLTAAARARDGRLGAHAILDAYPRAVGESRCALLRALRVSGDPDALDLVRRELDASEASVAETALRVMADWPRTDPAEDLLARARSETNTTRRLLAFRGAVEMAGRDAGRSPERSLSLLAGAMNAATRTEDKWLILGALMNVPSGDALRLAESCLDDPALAGEGGMAVLKIAAAIAATQPETARKALARIATTARDATIRKQAQALLRKINAPRP